MTQEHRAPPLRERRATILDLGALLALENACYPDFGAYARLDYVAALLRSGAINRLLLEDEPHGVPAAFGGAFLEERGSRGRIYTLNVRPDLQGRGIGGTLLDLLEDRIRAAGARRILLEVWVENHRAIHLYEAHGYERIHSIIGYYTTYPGSGDAYLYRKDLAPAG